MVLLVWSYLKLLHHSAGLQRAPKLLGRCSLQWLLGVCGGYGIRGPFRITQQSFPYNVSRGFEQDRSFKFRVSFVRGLATLRGSVSAFRKTNSGLYFGKIW